MTRPAKIREDARQNRRQILYAAEAVFEHDGVDAPLSAIIARAGISRATFFRHFPDRQELLAAILARTIVDLEQEIDQVRDPAHRLARIMEVLAEGLGARPSLSSYWLGWNKDHPALSEAHEKVEGMFADAIGPAKEAGLCRPDLTSRDMVMFARMIGTAVRAASPEQRAGVAKRSAQLLLEGYAARHAAASPGDDRN
ncbi:transcriptional regulator, TetR family [Sphingobium faniae]|nr:transcriptional regulator, TetR family [Sphingobium faniae]